MISFDAFRQLLSVSDLDRLAVKYRIDEANSVKLSGSVVFLCLLNGLLNHPELSLRLLEESHRTQTGETCDHSSFSRCLSRIPTGYFEDIAALLRERLASETTPQVERTLHLRFVDATTVTLSAKLLHFGLLHGSRSPDKSKRHVKSVWEIDDDGLPGCLHLCKTADECSDNAALGSTMKRVAKPGDLFVFDKGCDSRDRLLALHEAKAHFLTPLGRQKLAVRSVVWSEREPAPSTPPEKGEPRFVPRQASVAVFENSAEARSRAEESRRFEAMPLVVLEGLRFDERAQAWKSMTLLTDLEWSPQTQAAGPYSVHELAGIYARRWDIEVFFKLAKQHLSLSHLVSRSENGIGVMLAMAQITALLMIWHKSLTKIDRGWRSVKYWLAEDVREWTQIVLAEIDWRSG